jgi:hypothetical protein
MSYLLYCIFPRPLRADLEIPNGVGGRRVFTVGHQGLGVALSELAEADLPRDTPQLLVYGTVVESFYRHLTLIPLRYGCRVGSLREAVGLLRKNRDAYVGLLHELEGLAEMGIQVLLDDSTAEAKTDRLEVLPEHFSPRSRAPGAAYLDAKKLHYLGAQRATMLRKAFVEKLCDSLCGSFVRHKVELPSSSRSPLMSLYFLVPRDSVEPFRRAARHQRAKECVKLLLSGPWPPYNFVDSLQP